MLKTRVRIPVPKRIFLRSTDPSSYGNAEFLHENIIIMYFAHLNAIDLARDRTCNLESRYTNYANQADSRMYRVRANNIDVLKLRIEMRWNCLLMNLWERQ
ncbi:hypothetical protein ANN_07570 [Periplaneta americana]|uniref:Uncharacterized protein n=1 Tax=Periplaneta americana TaxID=6978 RepID=A0ABQ8T076_PERAM|nr:hypothetical protein ANN_07570 [Periplaneta americana]